MLKQLPNIKQLCFQRKDSSFIAYIIPCLTPAGKGLIPRDYTFRKGFSMLSEVQTKSANFLRIVSVLRRLRKDGTISAKEYNRAKKYYQQLTGADIILAD